MRAVRDLLSLLVLFAAASAAASAQGAKTYVSPDKTLRAIISPVGLEGRESVVEIRGAHLALLLKKSFASEDGEHGYGVIRAEWTPDSRFFVFSVESFGGHQPWHAPTFIYRRGDRRLLALDDFVGPISSSRFELRAPDLLDTEKWVAAEQSGRKLTVKLSELSSAVYSRKGARGIGSNR